MKKVLSVIAISAFVLTANAALAGGRSKMMDEGCQEACQQQIDDLLSSQAQQDELLNAHGAMLDNHENRITALEWQNAWYGRLGIRAPWLNTKALPSNYAYLPKEQSWNANPGFGGAIAFGRHFGNFRAELEFAYQGGNLKDTTVGVYPGLWLERFEGDYGLMTIMANGYYEVPIQDGFSLYGMAGLGFAKFDIDGKFRSSFDNGATWGDKYEATPLNGTPNLNSSDNVFAYKLGAGVTYNFNEQWAADLGYEFLGVADTDIADSINGHNIVLSVRFKF